MTAPSAPEILVRHPDVLGESPAYDAANQRLLWVDTFGQKVRELTWRNGGWAQGRTYELGQLTAAAVPRANGGILVAGLSEFLLLSDDGRTTVLASVDGAGHGVRLSDAKCDARGRLVAGLMAEDRGDAGGLLRLDPDGTMEIVISGLGLPNGLDWSPGGETFYLVDSFVPCVEAYDYDVATGRPANRRRLISFERGSGGPSGLAVDHEGFIWVTLVYAGEVRCYGPDGRLADILQVPTPVPTSCAFGGPDGDELFITSKSMKGLPASVVERVGLTPLQMAKAKLDRLGGALFVFRPGASGPPATPFAG